MEHNRPPFRADHVGSLLRPASLIAARARRQRGEISAMQLRAIEDETIRSLVARQESVGLQAITDGEARRDFWHIDFLSQFDGVATTESADAGMKFKTATQSRVLQTTGRVRCSRPIMADDFAFLGSITSRTAKQTIPSPSVLYMRGGRKSVSAEAYPDIDGFWGDLAVAYQQAIQYLADRGCSYLQLDDVTFSYLCDEKYRATVSANGDDPASLPRTFARVINAALARRPPGMSITMHTCRGNFRSSWFAEGGYEPVAEAMFSCAVDGFFMEFDSERAGTFEPLRYLPKDKRVVLGLVTTKQGTMESSDEIKRRIEQASRFVPIENLCLSPQCGFSSTHHGNALSEDEQWRKLEMIVRIADEVWGSH
jgi:5-methyltetrahydropteroyltriglutamate--homocysteine methyltransferase